MNDYLIDPMFFYWLNCVDGLRTVVLVFIIIAGIALVVFGIGIGIALEEEDDEMKRATISGFKYSLVFIVFLLLYVFIPSRETMIQMAVAKQVTYSNIKSVKTEIKSAVDYIFEKAKEIK